MTSLAAAGLILTACSTQADATSLTTTTGERTTTSESTSSTTSTRSDLEIADGAVLQLEDLPSGWGRCCPPEVPGLDQLIQHICGSPDGLEPRTAAFVRQFSLNLQPDGNEDGHLLAAVYLSPTEEAAVAEFAGVDAASYPDCMIEGVAKNAASYRPDRTGEPTVTFERAPLSADVPTSLDRFVSETLVVDRLAPMYTAILRQQVGRAMVRIEINTFLEPVSIQVLEDLAARSADLVRQSLADQ